jgi:hypothetical protein
MMLGGGDHVKIPLPYGYNLFWAMGQRIGDTIYNAMIGRPTNAGQTALSLSSTALDTLSPFGGGSGILSAMTPTVLKPVVELSTNKDFMGRPIIPNEAPYGLQKPMSQRYFGSTTGQSKEITALLNELTGGDLVKSGALDISPAHLDYFASYLTGGLGRTLGQSTDSVYKLAEGIVPDAKDAPVLNRFVGEKNDWYDFSRYLALRETVLTVEKQLKTYTELKDAKHVAEIRAESPKIISLIPEISRADKQLNALRRMESDVKKNNQMTSEAKQTKLQLLMDKRNQILQKALLSANNKKLL